jgi:hypothetical protein
MELCLNSNLFLQTGCSDGALEKGILLLSLLGSTRNCFKAFGGNNLVQTNLALQLIAFLGFNFNITHQRLERFSQSSLICN